MNASPALRITAAVFGALALLVIAGTPAAADPPRPTDFRSTVTDVQPALPPGSEVRVVGGDSFIELSIAPGHRALVADYPGSADATTVPYLRFEADGTVLRNTRAVATTANEARYGTTGRVPDPGAEPEWETVSRTGTYAWHDHRIHWMSPRAPRVVDDDGRVDLGGADGTWSIPVIVDGVPTVITGELVLDDPPSPLPWLLVIVAVGIATAVVALRFGSVAAAGAALVVAVAAVGVTAATMRAVPEGAGTSVVPLLLALVAVAGAGCGLLPSARSRLVGVAAAAACLLGWAFARWSVLTRAVLPTDLAPVVDRAVTAAAIGVGLGLAVVLVWRPPSRLPSSTGGPTNSPQGALPEP